MRPTFDPGGDRTSAPLLLGMARAYGSGTPGRGEPGALGASVTDLRTDAGGRGRSTPGIPGTGHEPSNHDPSASSRSSVQAGIITRAHPTDRLPHLAERRSSMFGADRRGCDPPRAPSPRQPADACHSVTQEGLAATFPSLRRRLAVARATEAAPALPNPMTAQAWQVATRRAVSWPGQVMVWQERTRGAGVSAPGRDSARPGGTQRAGTGLGRRTMPRRSRSACSARAAATSSGSWEIVRASQSI